MPGPSAKVRSRDGAGRWGIRRRPIGVFLGVVLLGTIAAAMIFLGLDDFYQRIAKGAILLLALGADQYGQRRRRQILTRRNDAESERKSKEDPDALQAVNIGEIDRDVVALEADGLTKTYGTVEAVKDVSFSLRQGEVTCLVGDNGAGKSTLIKMLAQATVPTQGTVTVAGRELDNREGAMAARQNGIETVWQDFAVCQNLGAVYNLCLGREPRKFGPFNVYDTEAAERIAAGRLSAISTTLDDLYRPLSGLSGGQRQSVAVARVVEPGVRVVILDEPTASLGVTQTKNVLELIRRLASSGVAVLLVSHDVEVVRSMADHYFVLRRGTLVADSRAEDMTVERLVHLMAGFQDPQTAVSQST